MDAAAADEMNRAKAELFAASAQDILDQPPPVVRGPLFSPSSAPGIAVEAAMEHMSSTGFQATHFARASEVIRGMLTVQEGHASRSVIYLGIVANLFATGVREALWPLAHTKAVDYVVVSGGGVEHDLRRLFPFHDYRVVPDAGSEALRGRVRIGDISFVRGPCNNEGRLCCFDHTISALIDEMIAQPRGNRKFQADECPRGIRTRSPAFEGKIVYTPSAFWSDICTRLSSLSASFAAPSFFVQCALAGIPVLSPSFVDGDISSLLCNKSAICCDLVDDLNILNRSALRAHQTGVIIVGGGVVKHHLCNANIMRNGADRAVFINTAQEFDGSDGGARPDEAVSWGKIKIDAAHVKVYAEATFVLPLLIASAFGPFCREAAHGP